MNSTLTLNPDAITKAMAKTGCSSVDELGWKFLGRSGSTLRNYLRKNTSPSLDVVVTLRRITGMSLEELVIEAA